MTVKQIKNLPPQTEVYAWGNISEGAVKVTIISSTTDNCFLVRRVNVKKRKWKEKEIPAENIFLTEEECERHCLEEEEKYNMFSDAFTSIHDYMAHLLFSCMIGRQMDKAEIAAAIERASTMLGCNMNTYINNYVNNHMQSDDLDKL